MIDEKKLIEEIEFAIKASNKQHDNYMAGLRNGMRYCLSLITGKEPEFERCEQWIPCSERLPEKHVDVLVDFGDENPIIAWYSSVNDTWKNSITDHVIHIDSVAWMPLPEPYKGE